MPPSVSTTTKSPNAATTSSGKSIYAAPSSKSKSFGNLFKFTETHSSDIQYIMNHAQDNTNKQKGWKHSQTLANAFKREMKLASETKQFVKARDAKAARDNWQKAADIEKTLHEKCNWAVGYAKEKMVYYSVREDFNKCIEFAELLKIANAYMETIPAEDKVIDVLEEESGSTAEAEASTTTGAAIIDVETVPPLGPLVVDDEEEDADDDDNAELEDDGDETAADNNGGVFVGGKKTSASRKRKARENNYKRKTQEKKKKSTIEKPPGKVQCDKFCALTVCKVQGTDDIFDPSKEHLVFENEYLYCQCCKKRISWNNRRRHLKSEAHKKAKAIHVEMKNSAKEGAKVAQQRITEKNLVGKNYSPLRIQDSMLWLRACFKGNISIGAFNSMRVSSVLCRDVSFVLELFKHVSQFSIHL